MKTIWNLERNNPAAALEVKHAMEKSGTWLPEYALVIARLQDDPKTLRNVVKALPRLSDDERASRRKKPEREKKAVVERAGSTGKTRYSYPQERSAKKSKASPAGSPRTEPTQSLQSPILASHSHYRGTTDHRKIDSSKAPKHTVSVEELCSALDMKRETLVALAKQTHDKYGAKARAKFTTMMQTQLREFAEEHGLVGDYFGLLFDVLAGAVAEGHSEKQASAKGGTPH